MVIETIITDYFEFVPLDYLADKAVGIVDRAIDAAVGAGSAALYGFLKI